MIYWAAVFLVIALVAAFLGFSGIAGVSMNIAWILFIVGLIVAVIFFIMGRRGAAIAARDFCLRGNEKPKTPLGLASARGDMRLTSTDHVHSAVRSQAMLQVPRKDCNCRTRS